MVARWCEVGRASGWCWRCYEGARCRRFFPGHAGKAPATRKRRWYVPISRKASSDGGGAAGGRGAAADPDLARECPGVLEYLTLTTFSDGSEREVATLLVFSEEGLWKACLNDRAEGCSLWATGSTLFEALGAMDAMLTQGTASWRRSGQARKRR